MKLTKRENNLLRRALDKASSPAEADMAAKALIASLRARDIDGYAFLPPDGATRPQKQPEASTRPPEATPNPTAGWPNQWRNAQAQASEEAQAQAWHLREPVSPSTKLSLGPGQRGHGQRRASRARAGCS